MICEAHSRENMVSVSGCVWCDLSEALQRAKRAEGRLDCALEAIAAHGNTERARAWYRKYVGMEVPTTVQYSLSCALMERARDVLTTTPFSPAIVERQEPNCDHFFVGTTGAMSVCEKCGVKFPSRE